MKICLINPSQIQPLRFGIPQIFQPLGLLYIAAVLERNYDVEIIDATLEGWKNLKEAAGQYYLGLDFSEIGQKINAIKPDVVGISVPFSINEKSALRVAETVKTVNKGIITILGGPHPTVRAEEILLSEDVDFVVRGEGEDSVQELIAIIKDNTYNKLKDVPGIGYKEGKTPVLNSTRPNIKDLDSLPFPARHLLPMEEYFKVERAKRDARQLYIFNERYASIITSRGCHFNCNFCSIHLTMGRQFRARSPENIISEIRGLISNYQIKHINFEDDNLSFDKSRFEIILDLIIENRLNITWSAPNGMRVDLLDEKMVEKMKMSGCKRVFVAPESGVQRVVDDIIKKNLELEKIEKAVKLFRKYGIIVDGSFVIGLIGETQRDIWETIKFALHLKQLGMDKAGIHIATPYYGTELFEEAKQKGFLRKDLDSSLFSTSEPLIETPQWTLRDIHILYVIANWLVNFRLRDKIAFILGNLKATFTYIKYIWKIFCYLAKRYKNNLLYNFGLFQSFLKNLFLDIFQRLPQIKSIVFEVTDMCNSRCKHCYIWKHKTSSYLLTCDDIAKMLKNEIFSNLKVVLITGGEPVLRDDIKEIIGIIHQVRPNVNLTLSTNGLLPDRVLDVLRFAADKGITLSLGVSLDGVGKKHDAIRDVEGNFEKVDYLLCEAKRLKEKYKDGLGMITVGFTLSELTINNLEEVMDYAKRLRLSFLIQLYEEFSFYHNEDKDKCEGLKNYWHCDNFSLINKIKALAPTFNNEILLSALKHKLRFRCDALRTFFLLRCNGDISACLNFSEERIGNVKLSSPDEIWKGLLAKQLRKKIRVCRGCSNSWAALWSFESWSPYFWKIMVSLYFKKILFRLKKI